eukprot:jgi/Tetstr1/454544/TSEL_041441.t1
MARCSHPMVAPSALEQSAQHRAAPQPPSTPCGVVPEDTMEPSTPVGLLSPGRAHRKVKPTGYLLCATACAALNSILLGYDIGVFGPAVALIRQEMDLSSWQVGWAAGSLAFSAVIGAIAVGTVSDRFGRVRTLMVASVFFLIGALLMAAAPNFVLLLLGRFVTGFGVGAGLSIDPLYISEISPPSHRGMLVSTSEVCINLGVLFGSLVSFVLGLTVDDKDVAWRLMLGIGGIVPVVILVLACTFLPETPRWLVEQDRHDEARQVMARLCHDKEEVLLTMADLQAAIKDERSAGSASWLSLLLHPTPGMRLMLMVVLVIAAGQQLTGVEPVTVFTPIILEDQAHLSPSAANTVYFMLTVGKTLVVVLAAALLDKIAGRRILLLVSAGGIVVSHLMIAGGFITGNVWASIVGLFFYVSFFSIGVGPVCWLFAAEILPTNMRAKGMMMACSANRLVSAVALVTFLQLEGNGEADESGANMGASIGFLVCAAFSAALFLFIYALVPETKGKTLEEMSSFFEAYAEERAGLLDKLCCCWPSHSTMGHHNSMFRSDENGGDGSIELQNIELVRADGNTSTWREASSTDTDSERGGEDPGMRA